MSDEADIRIAVVTGASSGLGVAMAQALGELGWKVEKPKASFFVWMPVPEEGKSSAEFASDVLKKAHVLITPGVGFGEHGEGYVRIALTVEEDVLREVLKRLEGAGFNY